MSLSNPDNYPIEALPITIKNAVLNVQLESQAPLALIASSALGVISLACQNSIDVLRPNGMKSPTSLFFLTIAESGERKTSVDKFFTQPIREFEKFQAEKLKLQLTRFEAEKQIWEIKNKSILAAIKKATKENEPSDNLTSNLTEHIASFPQKPKLAKLIYDDTTPAALKFGLYDRWPSAGFISDEAGSIFNGHAMSDLDTINTLWSGGDLQVDRRGSSSFLVSNARLTLSLMVQEKGLERYFSRRGSEARDTGLLARFLVAHPTSTQGSRFIQPKNRFNDHIVVFQDRVLEILKQNIINVENGDGERLLLEFSYNAAVRWMDAYNMIESDINPGRCLANIKDYAAKFAENIARLAALFHYFEGTSGEIPYETVDSAAKICTWHTHQFQNIFSLEGREMQDIEKLDLWLTRKFQDFGVDEIRMTEIRQTCPNSLRKNGRLNEALEYFFENDLVRNFKYKGTTYIELNPDHFGRKKNKSARDSEFRSYSSQMH